MPHLKQPKRREPLWKEWDEKAKKKGILHTVYLANGDEYTGEWLNDKKEGKGIYKYKKSTAVYDGDWRNDMRNGFGTYVITVQDGGYRKQYSGGWKNDRKNGYGTFFYDDTHYYEGEWYCDKRNGWGRQFFEDGSVYEGEWFDNQRQGEGILCLSNGNRYEGLWKNDKKNGAGKLFYLDRGQIYEGFWVDDLAKCGKFTDFDRESAPDPTKYPLPKVELYQPEELIEEVIAEHTATMLPE